jgi:hypothetical protein
MENKIKYIATTGCAKPVYLLDENYEILHDIQGIKVDTSIHDVEEWYNTEKHIITIDSINYAFLSNYCPRGGDDQDELHHVNTMDNEDFEDTEYDDDLYVRNLYNVTETVSYEVQESL